MELAQLLGDKQLKPKEKTETLSQWVLESKISVDELIGIAGTAKEAVKATCIEALEFATKSKPEIATPECLAFVTQTLNDKAPRVKWESAKVIGNIAHRYPTQLGDAVKHLAANAEHTGTVVRWSAAFALGEILKANTPHTLELVSMLKALSEKEEKNSIKKIYQAALKKVKA